MTVTLDGGTGNDSITASTVDDYVINGLSGNDDLNGNAGDDLLYGGDGDDDLSGDLGIDALYGGDGDDTLYGEDMFGGSGNDFLIFVQGPAGAYTLDGGIGDADRLSFQSAGNAIVIDLVAGIAAGTRTVLNFEEVTGSPFNDTLTGVAGITLHGGAGNDVVTLGSGGVLATGDTGNDTMTGGSGADSIYGGDGVDSIKGGDGADNLYAGIGAALAFETLKGEAGNDVLHLVDGGYATKAYGGDGLDTFLLGGSVTDADSMYGGAGVDSVVVQLDSEGIVAVLGAAGTLVMQGKTHDLQSIENITTWMGNDVLTGSTGANKIEGVSGNDTINGGSGNDSVYGGYGDDLLTNPDGKVRMYGDEGNDRLVVSNLTDAGSRIDGGAGTADVLAFTGTGAWVVDLQAGTLAIGAVSMTLAGIERVDGDTLNDLIKGSNGANVLGGGQGNDTLRGQGGDDVLSGGGGTDSIDGGAGNDAIDFGPDNGAETVVGGGGFDSLNVTGAMGWIFDDSGHGIQIGGLASVTVSGIEVVELTDAGDELTESGDMDMIYGKGGADRIIDNGLNGAGDLFDGGGGIDIFDFAAATGDRVLDLGTGTYLGNAGAFNFESAWGGVWNDNVTGTVDGNDLRGGAGNDTLVGIDGNDSLTGDAGRDSLVGGYGSDVLTGGADQDTLFGDGNADSLYGGASSDTLNGGGNNDLLDGGTENDLLVGNSGDDQLLGAGGQDRLLGGVGEDTLTGGLDADGFIWAAISEGGLGEAADVVTDFGLGADKLVLTAIGGLVWINTAGFSGVAGQVRQATTGANTVISVDSDGDLDADMEIVLQNHGAIAAGDVLL